MKKILLITILICTSLMCSCQTDDVFEEIQITQDNIQESDKIGLKIEKYMDQNSPGVSVQGAASYGDYLFQFENYNANVYIYNLKTKEFVEKVPLAKNSNNHCNNACFSNIFYEEGDEFPLLYVSGSRNGKYNNAQVYRIRKEDSHFAIFQTQEIVLPPCNENNNLYWTGIIMDNENSYMYVYANNNGAQIAKFDIPDTHLSETILTDEDILEQFSLNSFTHQQGAVISNGFLYVMDGVPQWGDTNYLRIIDLVKLEDHTIYNVSEMGFNQEFEGLTIYNDKLIAPTNSNAGIFSITIIKR